MNSNGAKSLWSILGLLLLTSTGAQALPAFSKFFTPSSIAPGGISTLTYVINNSGQPLAQSMAFSETFPSGLLVADQVGLSSDCLGTSGSFSATAGASSVSLTGGSVGAGESCAITFNVTASAAGTYSATSGGLTSDQGNSGSSTATLVVDNTRPVFSKSFADPSLFLGERTALTFTVDNTASGAAIPFMSFSDPLPAGLVVADPPNAINGCGGTVSASAGGSSISLANGSLGANASCTLVVDVLANAVGTLQNLSNDFVSGIPSVSSGKAGDSLTVKSVPITLTKAFVDDPTPPAGQVVLEFTITNLDRNFSATSIAFSDDLGATLSGLVMTGLDSNSCGGSLSGSSTISLSGGSLAAEGICTIRAILTVPGNAAQGSYVNTTSSITATLDGSPITGNAASDTLFIEPAPIFTKEFIDDPTTVGGTVTLRFTITNTDPTGGVTGIEFSDDIGGDSVDTGRGGALTGLAANGLVSGTGLSPQPMTDICGTGSELTIPDPNDSLPAPPFPDLPPDPTFLVFTGGSLAAAGSAGDSCSFDVVLDVPGTASSGSFINTTSDLSATPIGTGPAVDALTVVAAPTLIKSFTDDPVSPGGSVTLQFSMSHPAEATTSVTDIAFTDDLTTMGITGLVVNLPSVPDPPCGTGSTLTAPGDVLTLQAGTLAPGETCTFEVTLDIPALAAPGTFANTTSDVTAMDGGLAVISGPASDDLKISGLVFTKEFIDDPLIAGDKGTLRFTIANIHPTDDATSIAFADNLANILPGASDVTANLVPLADTCNGTMGGTSTNLSYSGGSLLVGQTCTIDLEITVPTSAADGSYGNITGYLTAVQGGAVTVNPGVDNLTVNSTQLQLVKSFTDDPVAPGGTVLLKFTLTNLSSLYTATSVGFTDDLDATLTGLTFNTVQNDGCSATITGMGTSLVDVSAISLAPSTSCEMDLLLDVPASATAGTYTNTSSSVSGLMNGLGVVGSPATDQLSVLNLLTFSKSFDGPTTATGTAVLTFNIQNPGSIAASGVQFSDDLDAVLTGLFASSLPTEPCGLGSSISGTSLLTFAGGVLPASGGSCSFDVEVTVPATATAGSYPNTTSDLLESGLKVADPATADLVIEPPPQFSKLFTPDIVEFGGVSQLVFTIDNSASVLAVTGLDFTDNLPAGVEVASTPNASTTCTGGTLTAVAGSGSIGYSGGGVAAGNTCTVAVDVMGVAAGAHLNSSGTLTSSAGASGGASDSLIVNPPVPPTFVKAFATNPIPLGGTSTLTFTIDNVGSLAAADNLGFTDNLPTGVTVAAVPNASTSCTGGTLTASPGSGSISYSGGSLANGVSCQVQVDVTSVLTDSYNNVSGDLTSTLGNSGPATATLSVNSPVVPIFSKTFAPSSIVFGGTSLLTFTIDNSASLVAADVLDFTDNLPAGITLATPANASTSCTGGTLTAVDGSSLILYTGGSVAASSSCTLQVEVTSLISGSHVNTSGDLTSSLGNSGPASATLNVGTAVPPGFAKAFAPLSIDAGGISTLTFTIDNSASVADATALNFSDTLPSGVILANPANASTSCSGGTLTAVAGTGVISYSGGSLVAGSSCTIQADVTSSAGGVYANTSGDLTSLLGNSGSANATLNVTGATAPGFTKQFAPTSVSPGGISRLSFTIDNTASLLDASNLSFVDSLPAGLQLATDPLATNDCGGSLTATGGTTSIQLSGGAVAASSSCSIGVNVTPQVTGTLLNLSGTLTSSLGDSGSASASLVVVLIDDGDGVTPQEESGPNGDDPTYDGNGDGIPDNSQSNVVSLHTYNGAYYLTLVSPGGFPLTGVTAVAPPNSGNPPGNQVFPFGFFSFTIQGINSLAPVTIQLLLPSNPLVQTYWNHGPAGPGQASSWYEFLPQAGSTGASLSGTVVTLLFTDGQQGDIGLSADGSIATLGGPGTSSIGARAIPTLSTWGLLLTALALMLIAFGYPAKATSQRARGRHSPSD